MVQSCPICSQKKISNIEQAYDGLCEKCSLMLVAYNRYAQSNIPIEYWHLDMKDFTGSKELKKAYDHITNNLGRAYNDGISVCFAGTHGVGKTFASTGILKLACQKNYQCLYTTLSDMINVLINAPHDDKYLAQRELSMCDWLVVDEFDSKYISDGGADLFGRMAEHLFRTRTQNKLPTVFCSNSPNPIEAFNGSIKASIESLFNRVKIIPILAEDFRKKQPMTDNQKLENDISKVLQKNQKQQGKFYYENGKGVLWIVYAHKIIDRLEFDMTKYPTQFIFPKNDYTYIIECDDKYHITPTKPEVGKGYIP